MTATLAPGHTPAVWIAAPTPVDTPHPSRQARDKGIPSGIRIAWASVTTVWVASVPQNRTPVSASTAPDRWILGGWASSCPHRRGLPSRH